MILPLFLFIVSFIFGILCGISLYAIAFWLSEHNIEVNFLLLRWHTWKYLKIYKQLKTHDHGRAGGLYYLFYISGPLTFLSFIGAIVAKIIAL